MIETGTISIKLLYVVKYYFTGSSKTDIICGKTLRKTNFSNLSQMNSELYSDVAEMRVFSSSHTVRATTAGSEVVMGARQHL